MASALEKKKNKTENLFIVCARSKQVHTHTLTQIELKWRLGIKVCEVKANIDAFLVIRAIIQGVYFIYDVYIK